MLRRMSSLAVLSTDWAALVLRVIFCGLLLYNHAFVKFALFRDNPDSFPDPLGFGAAPSFYLVMFAEMICGALVMLGLFTRPALVPLIITMTVALLRIHWENEITDKELPLLYLAVYGAIFMLGPGRFSVDRRMGY
ncbi:MAG TPA: DoxX family protein [Saprospiraceae bacterium]|nr:DoxX family protein [Saprospiraceae bacterium]